MKYPYQKLAIQYVQIAKRRGDLPLLDGNIECVDCGAPATCYEHRDYALPLDVEPTCHGCNVRRGPAKNSGSEERCAARIDAWAEKSEAFKEATRIRREQWITDRVAKMQKRAQEPLAIAIEKLKALRRA